MYELRAASKVAFFAFMGYCGRPSVPDVVDDVAEIFDRCGMRLTPFTAS